MTDFFFSNHIEDWNYLANRQATTIVGSSIHTISPRALWSSVGENVEPQGHDAFLTLLVESIASPRSKPSRPFVKGAKRKKHP
jgi:hypothetical protein